MSHDILCQTNRDCMQKCLEQENIVKLSNCSCSPNPASDFSLSRLKNLALKIYKKHRNFVSIVVKHLSYVYLSLVFEASHGYRQHYLGFFL